MLVGVPENERRDIEIGTCIRRKCSGDEGMPGDGVALWSAYMLDEDEGDANPAAVMGYAGDGRAGLPDPRVREG